MIYHRARIVKCGALKDWYANRIGSYVLVCVDGTQQDIVVTKDRRQIRRDDLEFSRKVRAKTFADQRTSVLASPSSPQMCGC